VAVELVALEAVAAGEGVGHSLYNLARRRTMRASMTARRRRTRRR
jgi:hypothetical protein